MFQTGASTIPFHQVCVERSLTTLQIIGGTEAQQEPGNPGLNVEEPEAIQVISTFSVIGMFQQTSFRLGVPSRQFQRRDTSETRENELEKPSFRFVIRSTFEILYSDS